MICFYPPSSITSPKSVLPVVSSKRGRQKWDVCVCMDERERESERTLSSYTPESAGEKIFFQALPTEGFDKVSKWRAPYCEWDGRKDR